MHGDGQAREIDVREYLRIIRRRKWIAILAFIVVVGTSTILALVQAPTYTASTQVLVAPSNSALTVDPQNADYRDRTRSMQNEIEFIQSDAMTAAVTERLGGAPSISVGAAENADVLTLTASDGDADRAAEVANTYAETYLELRKQRQVDDYLATIQVLQARIEDLRAQREMVVQPLVEIDGRLALTPPGEEADALQAQRDNLDESIDPQRTELDAGILALESNKRTLEVSSQLSQSAGASVKLRATAPSAPTSPNVRRSATVGIILGLLIGIGLAFLFERIDDSVKTMSDMEKASGVPTLGLIPRLPNWRDKGSAELVLVEDPSAPASEAYRSLRTSMRFLSVQQESEVFLFTSANASEGKSTTVANLAVALARSGHDVIAVCCDLRRPRLHQFFGVPNDVGFTTVMVGDATLSQALYQVPELPRLRILPSGQVPPNPSELLSTNRAQNLLESLRSEASIVIIDSPPVLPVSDALVLSSVADGIVVVSSARSTTKKQVARTVELLARSDASVIGTVLNNVTDDDGYGYGYGYGYAPVATPGHRSAPVAHGEPARTS